MRQLCLVILFLFFAIGAKNTGYAQNGAPDKIIEVRHTAGSSQAQIKIFSNQNNIATISIMNLIGRSVRQKEYNNGDEFVTFSDLGDLPNGLYVVLAKDRSGKLVASAKFYL